MHIIIIKSVLDPMYCHAVLEARAGGSEHAMINGDEFQQINS